MSNVIQIKPNHADHISYYRQKFLDDMFEAEPVIVQPKYDGERMLIHFDDDRIYCTSRRISKATGEFTRNEDKLKSLREMYTVDKHRKYTVLDCECYSKDWSTIVGILHSLPERADVLSALNVPQFAVFDCLYYDGEDVKDMKYVDRLLLAKSVVDNMNYKPMHLVKFMNNNHVVDDMTHAGLITSTEDWQECMNNAIEAGFEGVVLKSLQRKYYDKAASLKCKKFETVDVVVCDYQQGTGKYSDTVGALSVGYYDPATDSYVKISNVNCGTDEERNMWRDRWAELKGSVIEVKCQEITDRSLRHPVYIRLREDKNAKECLRDTIFR